MGWASGFQAGTQLAKAALEAEQRRRLQEVANEQVTQQYTPEQGAEMQRIAGLQTTNAAGETVPQFQFTAQPGSTAYGLQKFNVDTGAYEAVPSAGVGSAAYQVTPKQQLFGQTYDQLSEDQIRGIRMGKMADVIAETDPIKAQQLRAQQAEQEYLAKMRPMQVEAAELGLKKGRREDTEATNYANFSEFASANPDMPAEQLRKAAREQFKLTPDQETKYIANRLQLREIDLKNFTLDVQDAIKGKNLSQLKTLYNTDPRFDDKTDIDVVPGKNGQVTVKFIDKASGNVLRTNGFGSEALAIEYLGKQATDPMNTGSWLLGVQDKQASINQKNASAEKDRAYRGAFKSSNLVDVVKDDGTVGKIDMSNPKYMKDGDVVLPKGWTFLKAERQAAEMPPAMKSRYDALLRSDEWKYANTPQKKIDLLLANSIDPAATGMQDPQAAFIEAMRKGGGAPQQAQAPGLTRPTAAGQQLLDVTEALAPRRPVASTAPTTSAERLRGLYLRQ